jgi:CRP/FNR family cyclic AMP-dependent transcriptional regulator
LTTRVPGSAPWAPPDESLAGRASLAVAATGPACYRVGVEAERDFVHLFRHSPDAKTLAAGSVLFEAGQPGDALYVILSGQVEIRIGDRVVETVGAGGIVGELGLIDRAPRSATATVASEATVVPIDERRFLFLVQQTPYFALNVMRVMADRLRNRTAR